MQSTQPITFSRRLSDQLHYLEAQYCHPAHMTTHELIMKLHDGNNIHQQFKFQVHASAMGASATIADDHIEWAKQFPRLTLEMLDFAQAILLFFQQKAK